MAWEWVYTCVCVCEIIISFGMLGRMVFGMSSSIYMYKITHECRIISLCIHVYTHIVWVQWLTYSCPIFTHSSLSSTYTHIISIHARAHHCVGGFMSVCMCALVAMRRGLAAMRRKTFHIPVCFFFFVSFWALSHIPIEQQSLGVLFSIH